MKDAAEAWNVSPFTPHADALSLGSSPLVATAWDKLVPALEAGALTVKQTVGSCSGQAVAAERDPTWPMAKAGKGHKQATPDAPCTSLSQHGAPLHQSQQDIADRPSQRQEARLETPPRTQQSPKAMQANGSASERSRRPPAIQRQAVPPPLALPSTLAQQGLWAASDLGSITGLPSPEHPTENPRQSPHPTPAQLSTHQAARSSSDAEDLQYECDQLRLALRCTAQYSLYLEEGQQQLRDAAAALLASLKERVALQTPGQGWEPLSTTEQPSLGSKGHGLHGLHNTDRASQALEGGKRDEGEAGGTGGRDAEEDMQAAAAATAAAALGGMGPQHPSSDAAGAHHTCNNLDSGSGAAAPGPCAALSPLEAFRAVPESWFRSLEALLFPGAPNSQPAAASGGSAVGLAQSIAGQAGVGGGDSSPGGAWFSSIGIASVPVMEGVPGGPAGQDAEHPWPKLTMGWGAAMGAVERRKGRLQRQKQQQAAEQQSLRLNRMVSVTSPRPLTPGAGLGAVTPGGGGTGSAIMVLGHTGGGRASHAGGVTPRTSVAGVGHAGGVTPRTSVAGGITPQTGVVGEVAPLGRAGSGRASLPGAAAAPPPRAGAAMAGEVPSVAADAASSPAPLPSPPSPVPLPSPPPATSTDMLTSLVSLLGSGGNPCPVSPSSHVPSATSPGLSPSPVGVTVHAAGGGGGPRSPGPSPSLLRHSAGMWAEASGRSAQGQPPVLMSLSAVAGCSRPAGAQELLGSCGSPEGSPPGHWHQLRLPHALGNAGAGALSGTEPGAPLVSDGSPDHKASGAAVEREAPAGLDGGASQGFGAGLAPDLWQVEVMRLEEENQELKRQVEDLKKQQELLNLKLLGTQPSSRDGFQSPSAQIGFPAWSSGWNGRPASPTPDDWLRPPTAYVPPPLAPLTPHAQPPHLAPPPPLAPASKHPDLAVSALTTIWESTPVSLACVPAAAVSPTGMGASTRFTTVENLTKHAEMLPGPIPGTAAAPAQGGAAHVVGEGGLTSGLQQAGDSDTMGRCNEDAHREGAFPAAEVTGAKDGCGSAPWEGPGVGGLAGQLSLSLGLGVADAQESSSGLAALAALGAAPASIPLQGEGLAGLANAIGPRLAAEGGLGTPSRPEGPVPSPEAVRLKPPGAVPGIPPSAHTGALSTGLGTAVSPAVLSPKPVGVFAPAAAAGLSPVAVRAPASAALDPLMELELLVAASRQRG